MSGMRLKQMVAFGFLAYAALGFAATPPSLSTPTLVDGQVEFTLTGESNRAYRIDASTNLQTWFPVATNTGTGVSRQIRVPRLGVRSFYRALARTARFNFAIAAFDRIDLNGNNIVVDGFDSEDPLRSTAGFYDPLKHTDGGDIASNGGLANAGNLGNAEVYGRLFTRPLAGILIGPNGSVGSLAFNAAGQTGVEPGWWRTDLQLSLPDVAPPRGPFFSPASRIYNGSSWKYALDSATYELSSLSLSGSEKLLVAGNATLLVTSAFNISGGGQIEILPGASLDLYVAAPSASLGGNGVRNPNAASAFVYYGLPAHTALSISAPSNFVGCVYVPDASLYSQSTAFYGAIVARSVILQSNQGVHYDAALRRTGPLTW